MTETAPARTAPLAARLWFGYVLLANALVLLVLWIPAMLDLRRSHTVRTFQRWARPWSQAALGLAGIRVETVLEPGAGAQTAGTQTAGAHAAGASAGPVVYVANHQAMADIPVLLVAIREPFLFVARVALARLPLVGPVLSASVCVFLDRSQPGGGEAALVAAEARLALGESVLFFPEGTRRYDGRLGPFYPGAFRLAQRAGVAVVPVAVGDTHALLDERRRTARPGRVAVRVGAPIPPGGAADAEALAAQARAAVAALLGEGKRATVSGRRSAAP